MQLRRSSQCKGHVRLCRWPKAGVLAGTRLPKPYHNSTVEASLKSFLSLKSPEWQFQGCRPTRGGGASLPLLVSGQGPQKPRAPAVPKCGRVFYRHNFSVAVNQRDWASYFILEETEVPSPMSGAPTATNRSSLPAAPGRTQGSTPGRLRFPLLRQWRTCA